MNKNFVYDQLKDLLDKNLRNLADDVAEQLLMMEIFYTNVNLATNLNKYKDIKMDLLANKLDSIFYLSHTSLVKEVEETISNFVLDYNDTNKLQEDVIKT